MSHEVRIPAPVLQAEFHVEPHPDPVVRALIAEVERLRAELASYRMKERNGFNPR